MKVQIHELQSSIWCDTSQSTLDAWSRSHLPPAAGNPRCCGSKCIFMGIALNFRDLPHPGFGPCPWTKRAFQVVLRNQSANVGRCKRRRFVPGSGRTPGDRHGNPLQYSCLENLMNGGIWKATVPRVTKSWTWLKWLSMHAWPKTGWCRNTKTTPCL